MAYKDAVMYDGVNDRYVKGGVLTGDADSKKWTGSVWFTVEGNDASLRRICGNNARAIVRINASNLFDIRAKNSSGTEIWSCWSSTSFSIYTTTLQHAMWSCDLANGYGHLYINGSDEYNQGVLTNANIDFTYINWAMGTAPNVSSDFNGKISMLYVWHGTYVDLSQASNRELFYISGKTPASVGSGLGTPIIAIEAQGTTNAGSGGNLTAGGDPTFDDDGGPEIYEAPSTIVTPYYYENFLKGGK